MTAGEGKPIFVVSSFQIAIQGHSRLAISRPPTTKNHNLGTNMSHHSSSVNGKGTSHKDPLSRILDELSSLKLSKEKLERKEKGKERVKTNQDEREQIREEERRKILATPSLSCYCIVLSSFLSCLS